MKPKAEAKQKTETLPVKEEKKPTQQSEAGSVKPWRGLWELEVEEAEKVQEARMHGGDGGRPWFNGRPIRNVVKKLEDIYTIGGRTKQACAHAEISEATYYDFVKDKPNLAEHFGHLKERLTITALHTVAKTVPNNPSMAMTILERRMGKDFAETHNININSQSTSFSIHAQLMALSNEFNKRFLEEINKADIKGEIPPDSDDFVMEPPQELLDKNNEKVVESKKQVGGAAIPSGS